MGTASSLQLDRSRGDDLDVVAFAERRGMSLESATNCRWTSWRREDAGQGHVVGLAERPAPLELRDQLVAPRSG